MGGEPNQVFWRGIRPTDPPENIPVDIKATFGNIPVDIQALAGNLPVDIKSMTGNMPTDIKAHTVNTPVDVKSHDINTPVDIKVHTVQTPVDIKAHTVNTPIVPATPPQNIPVDIKSVTGNTPIIPSSPAQNIPVEIKDVDGYLPVLPPYEDQDGVYVSVINPSAGDINFDTGPLSIGRYDFMLTMVTDVDHSNFILQFRNSANTSTLNSLCLMTKAYCQITLYIKNHRFMNNRRFRVFQVGDLAGRLAGGIWWTQTA